MINNGKVFDLVREVKGTTNDERLFDLEDIELGEKTESLDDLLQNEGYPKGQHVESLLK